MATSRNPNEVLSDATLKGYSRILFQQGKPVCDFELTLLGDLANPQRLAAQYIGSGVPLGSDDSFAIENLDIAGGDFTIRAGRCLVNGFEVLLRTPTTYKTQPHKGQVRPFPANKLINVYLRVFPREVTDREDEALQNKADVGVVTSLREKTDWEVLATDATINLRDHFLLATFNTRTQFESVAGTLVDRRRKGLTMAKLRDEFDALGGTASNLNDRLNASLNPDGTLKNNVVGTTQLANSSVTSEKIANETIGPTKLSPGAVSEAILADGAVSNRTIQDRAVSLPKLNLTAVFDGSVSVPAAKLTEQKVVLPGETIIALQLTDDHAFYLSCVRATSEGTVNWMSRSTSVLFGLPPRLVNQYQIVVLNSGPADVTVECRVFRFAGS